MTASGSSRFKIVPVDSRYKRGRWACWDYYDNEEPKRSKETLQNRPSINVHKNQDSSTATSDTSRGALKCSSVTFAIESSDENSDMENDPPEKSPKQFSSSPLTDCNRSTPISTQRIEGRLSTRGRDLISPFDLERSLGSGSLNEKSILDLFPGAPSLEASFGTDSQKEGKNSTVETGTSEAPPMIAIDNKIEQAMDLVKTHLMFAVREEVESLKTKIGDLESTVGKLEVENTILREHVPLDILKKLNIGKKEQPSNLSSV